MGLALFLVYGFIMLVVVRIFSKNQASTSSFYINNRNSSAAMVAFSIIASCIGASATMGTIGLAFTVGTPAFWWLGSGAIGLSVMTIFLARRVRASQAYTLPQLTQRSLGNPARRLISWIIVVAWAAILAAQFTAISHIIQALTGLPRLTALLAGALLIAGHTLFCGQSGIIKLDRIQCLLMTSGLLLLAWWLLQSNPNTLADVKLEIVNEHFSVSRLIYFLLVLGGSYVVCPMLFGRLLSARSEGAAQKGALGAVMGLAGFSVLIVVLGLLCQGLVPAGSPPDTVLTTVLATVLPTWLSYVIYLCLLNIILSSADSCLLTAALTLAGDLWGKNSVKHARICVGVIALTAMSLTFMDKGILGLLLMANDIYVCGVVGPVFVAIIMGERATARGAIILTAIGCGGLLGLAASISEMVWLSYWGIGLSCVLSVLSFVRNDRRAIDHDSLIA